MSGPYPAGLTKLEFEVACCLVSLAGLAGCHVIRLCHRKPWCGE